MRVIRLTSSPKVIFAGSKRRPDPARRGRDGLLRGSAHAHHRPGRRSRRRPVPPWPAPPRPTDPPASPDSDPRARLTVIGNTGDDITLFGLRVCPDIDTLLYTLGGGIHEGQGWGRADESHHLAEELAALGAEPQWFTLGDKDFGTHVYRSQLLGQGMPLSAVIDAALRPLGARRARGPPAADDRHPRRDPRRGRAGGRAARDPLPGVVGAAPGRAARRAVRRGRPRPGDAGARACSTRSARPTS